MKLTINYEENILL